MLRWFLLGMLSTIAVCACSPKSPPLPPVSCRCSPYVVGAEDFAAVAEELFRREQWDASRVELERCIGLAPNHAGCHHLFGLVLERQDQPAAALEHYLVALRQAPGVAKYYGPPTALCTRYKLYDTADALAKAGLTPLDPPPIPPTPKFPDYPLRSGEAYTVWGAGVLLRGHDRSAFKGGELSITGVIGYSNLEDAPRCALHRPGVADPEGCTSPIPTFWLCDTLDAPKSDCIQVMGWASNYAQIWGGIMEAQKPNPEPYIDSFWGTIQPSPIPQRGARATVTGWYGNSFTLATSGASVDPVMGILTYKKLEWIEAPKENPKLPGM
jgi:hypothetical protein